MYNTWLLKDAKTIFGPQLAGPFGIVSNSSQVRKIVHLWAEHGWALSFSLVDTLFSTIPDSHSLETQVNAMESCPVSGDFP